MKTALNIFGVAIAVVFLLSSAGIASAQGRPGGGRPPGGGQAGQTGRPTVGAQGGMERRGDMDQERRRDTARGDRGYGTGDATGPVKRFEGLSKRTGLEPAELESRYAYERNRNEDLTYGQFVAAHMIGMNGARDVTTDEILSGLRDGRTIGDTLRAKGWDEERIRKVHEQVRKGNKKNKAYKERKGDW